MKNEMKNGEDFWTTYGITRFAAAIQLTKKQTLLFGSSGFAMYAICTKDFGIVFPDFSCLLVLGYSLS